MSITLGNPIIITSGQLSSPITRNNINISYVQWINPQGTSGVVLRKHNLSGPEVVRMVNFSSEPQTLDVNLWVNDLYCESVGAGTLNIYTK
jgi:hypothetical protein